MPRQSATRTTKSSSPSARSFDDLAFFQDPDRWPNQPLCPVKNPRILQDGSPRTNGGMPACGLLYENTTPVISGLPRVQPIVYLVGLFDDRQGKPIKSFPAKQYDSLEAMVADGWIVD